MEVVFMTLKKKITQSGIKGILRAFRDNPDNAGKSVEQFFNDVIAEQYIEVSENEMEKSNDDFYSKWNLDEDDSDRQDEREM
jgi:hypothetical protein